ncbi:MAG: ABC transporter ATP-binding protein [Lachnospiraceae bacterium]|nr:ABC transporter ATP-binding protein [Lachnospiraceae bacterium]MDY5700255.1 ABC transporter ATP-binding protein [Lachnospiraceae bacterium]
MVDIIKKLFSILSRRQKRNVGWMGVMILIGALLETVGVSMIVPLAQAILDADKLAENEYVILVCDILGLENMNQFVILMLVAVIAVFVIKNAYLLLMNYVQARFVNNNQFLTVNYMLEEYLNRPYEFYLNADIPTVFRTVDSDVPKVFIVLLEFIQLMTEVVVSIFLCVVLLIVDPTMTIMITAILLGMTAIIVKIVKPRLNALGQENQAIQARMGKWRNQSIFGIKEVKVLHKEKFFVDNFSVYSRRGADLNSKYTVFNNAPRLLIETICIGGLLGYMALCILMGMELTELAPQIMAFAVAAIRLMPSVNRINSHVTNIAFFGPSVDFVYHNIDFHDYKEERKTNREEITDQLPIEVKDTIALNQITYAYPNTTKLILDKADMVIPVGKSVGIIGPSGAGKTTAVDILMGLLQIQGGTITCGGRNVMENYPSWLGHIGYIAQNIYLTDDPVRDNIAFGVNREEIDDRRVWEVLEEAQMKEFVLELPEGLDTSVGERGVRISGGQRQRLGIARALYHNPEILVFDEATSALDTETETAIMEAIDKFHGKKTLIIIAHRLRTIENCDLIFRVENGKIQQTTL